MQVYFDEQICSLDEFVKFCLSEVGMLQISTCFCEPCKQVRKDWRVDVLIVFILLRAVNIRVLNNSNSVLVLPF